MESAEIVAHIPRLRRYARALAGDSQRADDLVQDTLERALGKFHLWRRGSDMRAWMFAIMHNVFINQLKARRELALDEAVEDGLQSAPQSDPLELRDLDAALRRLPAEQREVLLLVGLEQLSYAEASQALNVPVGTVMSRLSRGRERLRALMSGAAAAANLKLVK
ncbi:MAG: sigma-70 family RNA polymerase sigma factor [Betaproteobacteria bacterium]|nr:sigma-70 family RNA polymerase sigma factor [Betaproteobacteria bacterium]OGA31435.1 MAG: RNA polymerase subunit sigma-24 [Betaproteobacteria bacterium RIFCSPLOWO2_12_FULL_64_23]